MMDTSSLGLRDGILILAGLAGVYFVFLLLRLTQVKSISWQKRQIDPVDSQVFSVKKNADRSGQDSLSEVWSIVSVLEAEIEGLRREVGSMRQEIESMRGSLSHLKTSGHVSPLYSEAMGFARQGLDAKSIAPRCGIAVAEAELIVALVRGESAQQLQGESGYGSGSAGR
ncbi:MAG: DUF2802 domain-containing protein [Proteobacteria bacterium]|nr:DUF2802 domain-containing protein [Pseudomonadota bacterium]HQR04433.1 DUF2802 domain-containing protein [Rhodocyclaceae bacterium]